MTFLLSICLLFAVVSPSSQVCTSLPGTLDGTWTSTSLETITISSSAMTLSTTFSFDGTSSGSHFECQFDSGTQYVFKMNETVSILSGSLQVFPYGCFDFRKTSDNSYYFYLNSGSENEAVSAVQCPDPILGFFDYTYTDLTGTSCDNVNTSTLIACSNQSHAEVLVDNTGCTEKDPFYSSDGQLGCIANVYSSSSNTYYVSFYNKDVAVSTTTFRFTCVAMQKQSNGTVFLSLMPTNCIAGQTATVLPTVGTTTGATMVLKPFYTCVPDNSPPDKKTNWVWLIIFMLCFCALIILIIVVILLHRHCKNLEKKRAREKKILITEEHPLGEMSIALDAPASMERVPEGYIEVNNELYRSPRTMFKKKDMMNPMGESSMNLSFKEKSWVGFTPRKSIAGTIDPFTEMDSGVVLPLSSLGSKTARSMKSPTKQKSFVGYNSSRTPRPVTNGDVRERLAITDGRIPYPVVGADEGFEDLNREPSFVKESLSRSHTVYAPGLRKPSVHAPNQKALSVHAPSVGARSVGARSVAAKSTKSIKSNKAMSIRTNRSVKPAPKLTRSVTSTKLGSVTKGTPRSPKKRMNRSNTVVMPTETHDQNEGGMADFMNAEMSNWGDASETNRSKRSARTAKSKTSSKASSPRKSIQTKMTGIPNYFRAISVM